MQRWHELSLFLFKGAAIISPRTNINSLQHYIYQGYISIYILNEHRHLYYQNEPTSVIWEITILYS
jgi:hypothetical protein